MLQLIEIPPHMIPAINLLQKNILQQKISEILNHMQSETGGLAQTLQIKLNAQLLLTFNIDLQDRLVNGELGTIKHISIDTKGNATKMYIKLDDSIAGLKKINKDAFAKKHCWIPINKTEVDIRMKSADTLSPVIKDTVSINISMDEYSS